MGETSQVTTLGFSLDVPDVRAVGLPNLQEKGSLAELVRAASAWAHVHAERHTNHRCFRFSKVSEAVELAFVTGLLAERTETPNSVWPCWRWSYFIQQACTEVSYRISTSIHGMLLLDGEPLLRNAGQQAASCLVSYLCRNASLRALSEKFISESKPHDPHLKTIHVVQGEYAVVNTRQECQKICLSSCDATTCCIVALNCNVTGLCGIAHLDQGHAQQKNCLSPLLEGLVAPELYIIGGMRENTSCGVATAHKLLGQLEDDDAQINVQLACIGDVNTAHDGAPRCRSLAVTKSAESGCSPTNIAAVACDPSAAQRLARVFTLGACGLENIYDTSKQLLQISKINCNLTRQQLNSYATLLQCPDAYLLQHMSTSPQYEGASFVPGDALPYCDSSAEPSASLLLHLLHHTFALTLCWCQFLSHRLHCYSKP